MDARARPFGKGSGASDSLDGDHSGPREQMVERVIPPRRRQACLTTGHDRRLLGVQADAKPRSRDDLEALEHRPCRGCRQIAEGVAHKAFEGVGSGRDQALERVEIVLGEQAVEAEIDRRRGGERALLDEPTALRVGGLVFTISNTVVTPPVAAAAEPLVQSSFCV